MFVAQIENHGVLLIPSIRNVLPLSSGDNQGGLWCGVQGVNRIFNCIPNTIKLAGKTLKTDDKREAHKP